jgi:hypothetical protein
MGTTTASSTASRSLPWLLAAGDWLVLLAFVLIGQRDHNMTGTGVLPSLITTTLSVAVPWTIAAVVLGGYRPQTAAGLWPWLGRVLTIWLIAAPLGLILRALLRGQGAIPVPFMLVMIGLGGLFMLAWRAAFWWWHTRRSPSA